MKSLDKIGQCQQFFADTILVGGGLIIKNALDFENKSKLDSLKAHIIYKIRNGHKHEKPFEKDLNNGHFSEMYDIDLIPVFIKLDKQLQEEFIALYEVPEDASFKIIKRLVFGILGFHKEQQISD
ncbi:hypothetical protein C2G38_2178955 [Gigaspora rosea]|uniref:Uncharacterized protein n=1 Tax=Gigaspora rosea TaxID=44941 RepID=A0A397VGZ7_9GLOM|nr:hypothetical protein C2G38_2178955 [Gigaspora rosea]CAG8769167.1 20083_t:CDS:2 [Gigaspora rosea]